MNQSGKVWVVLLGMVVVVLAAWMYNQRTEQSREQAKRLQLQQQQQAEAERARQQAEAERREKEAIAAEAAKVEAGVAALGAQLKRWEEASKLASATGRIALAGPVADLQVVHRGTEALSVPECLEPAKAELLKSMAIQIEGFVVFMANNGELARLLSSAYFDRASDAMREHKARLKDC